MDEVPNADWGNTTPEGRKYRRLVTDKYGYVAFGLSVGLILSIALWNSFLGPVFFTIANERPTRVRKILLIQPMMKVVLWLFTAALVVITLVETENLDLIYVSKRLGRIIVALMPPMYFLTMRPSLLHRTFYLQLVPIHKFLSRVVVIFSVLHGVFYTVVYYRQGALFKLWKLANILGIVALAVFVLMALTGVRSIRRRVFEVFYQFHVAGAWSCIPMIRWHARPRCDAYMMMCMALLAFQIGSKFWLSATTKLRVQYVSPTLLLIEIPKTELSSSRWWSWPVASHLRLSRSISNPMNWVRSSHPYTIASLQEDESIKLVVRPGDFALKMRRDYTIFGPHNCVPNYLMHQIHSYLVSRVLLVIGGAGIAFGAPMMRYLRLHGANVRMMWVMRDPYDARVLPQLGLHEEVLRGNVEIYYTGEALSTKNDTEDQPSEDGMLTIGMSDNCCTEEEGGMGTIQSATRHPGLASRRVRRDPLLSQYAMYMANSRPHLNLRVKSWLYGYPLDSMDCCCADRAIDACAEDRLGAWVMCCGNEQLSSIAKKWSDDAGVGYFQDSFSL